MARLSSYKNVGVFTEQLSIPCKGDPFTEVSNIIESDGLISGDIIRISTYELQDGEIIEGVPLAVITIH